MATKSTLEDQIANLLHDHMCQMPTGWTKRSPSNPKEAARLVLQIEATIAWLDTHDRSSRDHEHALESLRESAPMHAVDDAQARLRALARLLA